MPTVSVDAERLFRLLEEPNMTIPQFEELCFDFGVELDDITSEREMAMKEQAHVDSALSDRTIFKIDVSANRYDLLCEEGLSRALRVFLGKQTPPIYKTVLPENPIKINVKPSVNSIRPFIVGAVLRNVTFDQAAYDSFIDLQEKLHQGLCRRRVLVAIGTHDLDTLSAPFSYEALPPKDIRFKPLNQSNEMDGNQLMEFYESDRRLSKFLPIIRDSPVYPVVFDAKRTVCSLPPIINGDHSKIKITTKNVFVECTATEESKARTVLNMVVTMFSQYCKDPFTVEQVQVHYEDSGKDILYPDLTPRTMTAPLTYINSCIGAGINLSPAEVTSYLAKMGLPSTVSRDENKTDIVTVQVPPTRSDVLHACDIMEDVAVAYGINRIPKTIPKTSTVGGAFPLNKLSDMVRKELALSGWMEVLPLTLCSHDENFAFLRRQDPGSEAVVLANPKTVEYEVVRTSLLPGLLKTTASNKKSPLPLKLFEVSDVVVQDASQDRRSRNERRVGLLFCNKTSGFEFVHGMLDRLMAMLNVSLVPVEEQSKKVGYSVVPSDLPTYFPGRQAEIMYRGKKIGSFGILHPECLGKFDVSYPCSCLEMNLEPFL